MPPIILQEEFLFPGAFLAWGNADSRTKAPQALVFAIDIARAIALDEDPTKCESEKVNNGKEILAFKSAVDRLEMKARNLRLRFIAL